MTWQSWQLMLGCLVAAITVLGTVVTVTAVIIQMKANVSDLRERDLKREAKEDEIDKQVIGLLVMFKEFVSAQTELNVTVKGFMEAQTSINERQANMNERMITETSHMTKATTEGSQIISLLTEVLKQRKVISSE